MKKQESTIGKRIKTARERHGWTQAEVESKCGVCHSWLAQFESDRRAPSARNIVRLCKALNVSSDEILGLTEA